MKIRAPRNVSAPPPEPEEGFWEYFFSGLLARTWARIILYGALGIVTLVLFAPFFFEWESAGDFYYATLSATILGALPLWVFWRSLERHPRTMATHRATLFLIVIVTFIFLILTPSDPAMTGPVLIFVVMGVYFRIDYSRIRRSARA